MAEQNAEIRIIKRKKAHAGHHGGAWKVAYADFVTAMMAFFLVMWIIGLSPTVKQAIAGYFKDPAGFMKAVNAGNALFKVSQDAGAIKANPPTPPPAKDSAAERSRLEAAKKAIEKMVTEKPEFKDLKKYVDIKLVPEGRGSTSLRPRNRCSSTAAAPRSSPLPWPSSLESPAS